MSQSRLNRSLADHTVIQIREGFIVDEDEDEEDAEGGSDDEARRAKRKREHRDREEEERLDEEDLELIDEQFGVRNKQQPQVSQSLCVSSNRQQVADVRTPVQVQTPETRPSR